MHLTVFFYIDLGPFIFLLSRISNVFNVYISLVGKN